MLPDGMAGLLANNLMMVAEAEFAFRMGRDLPFRDDRKYTVDEVLAAVEHLHPAIEIPDSRFRDFTTRRRRAAHRRCRLRRLVLRRRSCAGVLARHRSRRPTRERIQEPQGGRDGIGCQLCSAIPRLALTWLANEVAKYAGGLREGEFVSTGTCVVPVPVRPGDQIIADFGEIGRVHARLV